MNEIEIEKTYAEFDALLPYKRYTAVIQAGLDPLLYALHRQKLPKKEPKPKPKVRIADRQVRLDRLKSQGGNCAMCEAFLLEEGIVCYDVVCDDVVCWACLMATSHTKALIRRGVTPNMVMERLEKIEKHYSS